MSLEGKRIVLGVSGGIAAYKVADLASKLSQAGALVDVIMTESAQKFVTPLTFAALTHRPVRTDLYEDWLGDDTGHVGLAHGADILVVAPATAHTIARLALGLSDDFLSAVYLSTQAPVLIVPAMESGMYLHPATQEHLDTLKKRGAYVMLPDEGHLASGASGVGRMPEPAAIMSEIKIVLGKGGALKGQRVVVTAGGTHEVIDPVRFVGNGSSGKMGYAIAEEALYNGAEVTLITGPVALQPPYGVNTIKVTSAKQMEQAVREAVVDGKADVLIMAAAVADYAPAEIVEQKIKKTGDTMTLNLARNPDILGNLAKEELPGLLRIGFAAETQDLVENAREKLSKKKLDMIIANDAVASIGADTSAITMITPNSGVDARPPLPKGENAKLIISKVAEMLRSRS
ncbi:MAG: bifunctional phosphopantothenoylcysteine decarboxylase/phosphopantothenate--cysteine ligase CoaBC [Chloroflexia bacterium]